MLPKLNFQINLDPITRQLGKFPKDLDRAARESLTQLGLEVSNEAKRLCGHHYGVLEESIRVSPIKRDIRSSGRVSSLSISVLIDPKYSRTIQYERGPNPKSPDKKPFDYWEAVEDGRHRHLTPKNESGIIYFEKKAAEIEYRKELRKRHKFGKETGQTYEYTGVRNQGKPTKGRFRRATGSNFRTHKKGFMEKTRIFAESLLRKVANNIMRDIGNKWQNPELAQKLGIWDFGDIHTSARWATE